jgi:hypothetical protein
MMSLTARKAVLAEYRRWRDVPFAWGTADCLAFAAACAAPLIARDPVAHLRGRYDSEISSRRMLIEEGWRSGADLAASLFPEIPVAQAHAGDWAYVVNPDGTDSLGVVAGEMIIAKGQSGVGLVPLMNASRAFRVLP